MTLEVWLGFALACAVVVVIPGPTITLVVAQALAFGRGRAGGGAAHVVPALVAGVVVGDAVAVTVSMLGLGALLAASAAWFAVVKWLGAAYLIWLGVSMLRGAGSVAAIGTAATAATTTADTTTAATARRLFLRSFLVTLFNPKGLIFFIAFLPQFVNPAAAAAPQLLLLGATFVTLGGVNAWAYATFAARLRETLRRPQTRRLIDRCGGTALIGTGLITATATVRA